MTSTTVLTEEGIAHVEAHWHGDRVLIAPEHLVDALGWELKPQGLCRGDVCYPVTDPASLHHDDLLDLGAAAAVLGRPTLADPDHAVIVVSVATADRHRAIQDMELPPVTLPDLAGEPHSLAGFRGKKKLLVAFSSW